MQKKKGDLTFKTFQIRNRIRCSTIQGSQSLKGGIRHFSENWDLSDWALAINGEAGELANLVKKLRRGDFSHMIGDPLDTVPDGSEVDVREQLGQELADIITYCDLMLSALGMDTGLTVEGKFLMVSERWGYEG